MASAIAIVFFVVFALQATIIIIGNVLAISIFWTLRYRLKRTSFLLINLTVADLLVGIVEVVDLVIHGIRKIEIRPEEAQIPSWAFQYFASCTSIMFLALISLERVYAVLWPLRHLITNTRTYIYSIVTVWAAGLFIAGLSLLSTYHQHVDTIYASVTADALLFISLVVICGSYLSIRSRLHRTTPQLRDGDGRSTDQNIRLSKAFYIVVAVSLLLWLPAFLVYTIKDFCWQCFSPTALWSVYALHLANSMVNSFIYSFRMSIYQDALRRFICQRKRRQNLELKAIQLNVNNAARNEGFTTHL